MNKFGSSGTSQQAAAAPGPATAAESECSVRQITEIIQTLNPRAHIIPTNYCDVPLSEVIDTHRYAAHTHAHAHRAKSAHAHTHRYAHRGVANAKRTERHVGCG